MRLSADAVLSAVESPDEFARDAALEFFTGSFSRDPRVMSAVIRAFEKYGRGDWRPRLHDADNLVQSDESVRWLLAELATPEPPEARRGWHHALAGTLLAADPELLRKYEPEIAACPGLDDVDRAAARDRVALAALPPDELWTRLEHFCRATFDTEPDYPADEDIAAADRLAGALGAHPEFAAGKVLAVFRGETGDRGKWLELYAVRVARHARIAAAVPDLVRFVLGDDDGIDEEARLALAAIGSDETVELIRAAWPTTTDDHTRFSATFTLELIHSDRCVEAALALAGNESDRGVRCRLFECALRSFAPEAVEPAHRFVMHSKQTAETRELRYTLVAACAVMGTRFPEYDGWHAGEIRERERVRKLMAESWDEKPLLAAEPQHRDERPIPVSTVVNDGPKVGRNDPCPCGSGKKYKKCCGSRK